MNYWLEEKGECAYCGGSGRCYPCGGYGYDAAVPGGGGAECTDCRGRGSGTCAECVAGREMWLFFTRGDGKRGSMLRHDEALAYQHDRTLPGWWASYHGVPATVESES